SGALSISSNFFACAPPRFAKYIVMAAVVVVFPWSTWPIVPTFTCGFVRSNFCFATILQLLRALQLPRPTGRADKRQAKFPNRLRRHGLFGATRQVPPGTPGPARLPGAAGAHGKSPEGGRGIPAFHWLACPIPCHFTDGAQALSSTARSSLRAPARLALARPASGPAGEDRRHRGPRGVSSEKDGQDHQCGQRERGDVRIKGLAQKGAADGAHGERSREQAKGRAPPPGAGSVRRRGGNRRKDEAEPEPVNREARGHQGQPDPLDADAEEKHAGGGDEGAGRDGAQPAVAVSKL